MSVPCACGDQLCPGCITGKFLAGQFQTNQPQPADGQTSRPFDRRRNGERRVSAQSKIEQWTNGVVCFHGNYGYCQFCSNLAAE